MKSLQELIKENLENSNFISESLGLSSNLNNIINEARKTRKIVKNMNDVFLMSLKYIIRNGYDEPIYWLDCMPMKKDNPKLYDMLVKGGTKDSNAADEFYEAIAKAYKDFKDQPDPKNMLIEIYVESSFWIMDGEGETEPMNWLEAQGGEYYNDAAEMFKMISDGKTKLSKAADEFYDAIVKFYKIFNFKQ